MPSTYLLSPRALGDLDEIWDYIAEDSTDAANRVESAILSACEGLAIHPKPGSKRTEITALPGAVLDRDPLSEFHYCLSPEH
jgi:plasmid stabilization system protein ParE